MGWKKLSNRSENTESVPAGWADVREAGVCLILILIFSTFPTKCKRNFSKSASDSAGAPGGTGFMSWLTVLNKNLGLCLLADIRLEK